MQTTTLTAARPNTGRADLYHPRSLAVQDRVARRIGQALLDWSRRREERNSHESVLLHRQAALEASEAQRELHVLLATIGRPVA